jgi:hypothetical protein
MATDAPDADRPAPEQAPPADLHLAGYDARAALESLLAEGEARFELLRAERLARGGRFDRI